MLIQIAGAAILGILISRIIFITTKRTLAHFAHIWQPSARQELSIALATVMLFAITAAQSTNVYQFSCTVFLISILTILTLVDIQIKILPNLITLPLLGIGLILSLMGLTITIGDSLLGMALGYLILLATHFFYKLLTSREGVGFGDIKLIAAIGAWMGWEYLISIILISSISAALTGCLLISIKKHKKTDYMAFGPHLVGATLIILLIKNPFQ